MAKSGIKVASEKEQRRLSKDHITTGITTEIAPITHALKEEVKPDAIAYIPFLPDKVFEILDQQARYTSQCSYIYISNSSLCSLDQLTWHDGAILSDEIWVKIGVVRFLWEEYLQVG